MKYFIWLKTFLQAHEICSHVTVISPSWKKLSVVASSCMELAITCMMASCIMVCSGIKTSHMMAKSCIVGNSRMVDCFCMMDKSRMRLAISDCDNVFSVVLIITGTDSVPCSLYTLSKCPVFMQEQVRNNTDGKIHFSNMLQCSTL